VNDPQKAIPMEEQALSLFRTGTKVNCSAKVMDKHHLKLTWLVFFSQMSKGTKTSFEIRTAVDTSYPGVTDLSAQHEFR